MSPCFQGKGTQTQLCTTQRFKHVDPVASLRNLRQRSRPPSAWNQLQSDAPLGSTGALAPSRSRQSKSQASASPIVVDRSTHMHTPCHDASPKVKSLIPWSVRRHSKSVPANAPRPGLSTSASLARDFYSAMVVVLVAARLFANEEFPRRGSVSSTPRRRCWSTWRGWV